MKMGFLIDHRKCIGCHACSVACKEEHQVALGVYRTWVKYVEKGAFPNTQRNFTVLRCNHCEDAPCVTICPVTALYKADNGIVDFDSEVCIGCKACMQACPYDALYIDPKNNTAAKCNFCAHRVEVGLQPSCEIVCPTQAIVSGDLDAPDSHIAQLTTREPVRVRKPEKGTVPQLFYIDADENSLTPSSTIPPRHYGMWSEVAHPSVTNTTMPMPGLPASLTGPANAADFSIHDLIPKQPHTVYDVAHAVPWGQKVSLYIWTKSIAAGAFLVSALGVGLGLVPDSPLLTLAALLLSHIFLGITTGLLILDLKRPERFFNIVLRPQWRSWVAIGGFVLMLYGALLGLSFLAALFGLTGFRHVLFWPGGVMAIFAAIYTAFLFAQAKGRDFWLSPALPAHLLLHAVLAGAASLAVCNLVIASNPDTARWLDALMLWSLLGNLFITLIGELWLPHGTQDAAKAATMMVRGAYAKCFWGVVVVVGHAVPLLLLVLVPGSVLMVSLVAGVLSLIGLLVYEHLWLMAGQAVPLS
jgi:Fe-S-cluster-containing dehydrogenase component/formate-dependent nitrite reductase membrane component NrfD